MPKRRSEVDPDAIIIRLCRSSDWHQVLLHLEHNPSLATTRMIMDNHIATTIVHQAINSKSDTKVREHVIMTILRMAPRAASIRNGYNSLPLHVITQRNTKMDSQTKERLILALIQAYPASLLEAGGVGQRCPLHIIFTDYTSPNLVKHMIDMAPRACYMRDKNGWLPIHVACSRHCSPEKLRMLLEAYPSSLYETTPSGETLLQLAKERATKSHPNYALINELHRFFAEASGSTQQHYNVDYCAPVERRDEYIHDARQMVYSAGQEFTLAAELDAPSLPCPVTRSHRSKRIKREAAPTGQTDALANLLLHFHRNSTEDAREQDEGQEDETVFDGKVAAV